MQPDERSEVPSAAAVSTPQADSAGVALDEAAPSGMAQTDQPLSTASTGLQHVSAPEGDGAGPEADTAGRHAPAEPAQAEPPGQSQPDAGVVPSSDEQLPPIVLRTEPAIDSASTEPVDASPAAAAQAVPDGEDLRDEEPADATPEEQSGGACKQS